MCQGFALFVTHNRDGDPARVRAGESFYSPDGEALLFGYFRGVVRTVFLCLSHDIVVHETTHALVDRLSRRFTAPSSPDQA